MGLHTMSNYGQHTYEGTKQRQGQTATTTQNIREVLKCEHSRLTGASVASALSQNSSQGKQSVRRLTHVSGA